MSAAVWRDDKLSPHTEVTCFTCQPCAEDRVASKGIHSLVIVHVRFFRAGDWTRRGFMPSIRVGGGGATGEIHEGTDDDAYARARADGEAMLDSAEKALEDAIAAMPRKG